jgi:hypothetical protein
LGVRCSRTRARGARGIREEGALDDYYAGADGARRLLNELDHILQRVLDNVESAEMLSCTIRLRVKGAKPASLKKTYRPTADALEDAPASA